MIGCDLVVSSSPKASRTFRQGHTRAVVNTTEMATADFVRFRDASLSANKRVTAIRDVTGPDGLSTVAANDLAEGLLGNTIYANVLMLGYAWQKGLVPVSNDALCRAIELNGVEIEQNLRAFNWGRIAAADADFVATSLASPVATVAGIETLDEMIERRREFLVDYQNSGLADRFAGYVDRARKAESALRADEPFSRSVAKALFKTLAYKDAYEVARL